MVAEELGDYFFEKRSLDDFITYHVRYCDRDVNTYLWKYLDSPLV